jgi:hypothetical protein
MLVNQRAFEYYVQYSAAGCSRVHVMEVDYLPLSNLAQHADGLVNTACLPGCVNRRAFHCIHYAHKDGGHSDVSSTTHSRHGSGLSPMGTSYTPAGSVTAGSSAPGRAGSSSSVAHSLSSQHAAMHGSTLGKQGSGVVAAAAGDSGSFAEVCHQGGDTAVPVAEGAAARRVQFDAAGVPSHRVHFSDEGQQHSSSAGVLVSPLSAGSVDQQGSDGALQQQQQGAPDSFGSSVDCRCVAAPPSSFDSPQELRRGKSLSKPARRYESWLVLELCDSGSLSSYTAQWDPPAQDPANILQVLQLLLDTAQGLEALHKANTVHGDLVSGATWPGCLLQRRFPTVRKEYLGRDGSNWRAGPFLPGLAEPPAQHKLDLHFLGVGTIVQFIAVHVFLPASGTLATGTARCPC